MTEIFKLALVGIITAITVLIIREHRPDIALLVGIAGGTIILLSLVNYFTQAFGFLREIANLGNIDSGIIKVLLKVVAIGYITDFSAGIAEESGSKGLGEKIALGGKIMIFIASIPIIKALFDIVSSILL